jgi:hypothetical protein
MAEGDLNIEQTASCLRIPKQAWRSLWLKVFRNEGVAEHGSKEEGNGQADQDP